MAKHTRRTIREAQLEVKCIKWSVQHMKPAHAEALLSIKDAGLDGASKGRSNELMPRVVRLGAHPVHQP